MPLSVRGQTGQLKVGYQTAAELGPWEFTYGPQPDNPESGPPRGWAFSAKTASVNPFWADRERFMLVLDVGPHRWRFREVEAHLAGTSGSVTIQGEGRPEIS